MADFKYGGDVGQNSVLGMTLFAKSTGIPFTISNAEGMASGATSYHARNNAIDMVSSAGNMQALAKELYWYSEFWLELIHSGGMGYFVKNGKRVPGSFYGAAIIQQHYSHVHFAATPSGVAAAWKVNQNLHPEAAPTDNGGCGTTTAVFVGGVVVGAPVLVEFVQRIIGG